MSDLAEAESPVPSLLRDRSGVQRVAGLALLALAAHAIPALALAACAAVLVTAVAVSDRLPWLPHPAEPPRS
jgi:hypothetical protein